MERVLPRAHAGLGGTRQKVRLSGEPDSVRSAPKVALESGYPMQIYHDLSGYQNFKICFRPFTAKLGRRTRIQVYARNG